MPIRYARTSLYLFAASVVLWIAITVFESALLGTSPTGERAITFLVLVLPAAIGSVLAVVSLLHGEGRRDLAITGLILNTLFALFHLLIVLFAG